MGLESTRELKASTGGQWRVTRWMEVTMVITGAGGAALQDLVGYMRVHVAGALGETLPQDGQPIVSLACAPAHRGVVVERLGVGGEQAPGIHARYVGRCLLREGSAFWGWLAPFRVDSFSGRLSVDDAPNHGFRLPNRPADALWYVPEPLEGQGGDAADLDAARVEWWEESDQGVVLGLVQREDSVTGDDHFQWYAVPLAAVVQRRFESGEQQL